MWRITMPQIPFRGSKAARSLNVAVGRWLVRRAIKRLGFQRTISWFVVPHAGPVAGALAEDLIVYYCIDDYAALPDVDPREVARMDDDLTRRADQVFVASSTLLGRKRELNRSTLHSPHGVDVALFQKASEPSLSVAEGARNLRHPVIGFFGLIEAWIDLDLILYLARQRPDWTFLLIGRVAVPVGELAVQPNVVFTGAQPYEDLPRWAKAFDVAMIPYRLTEQVLHANPLKLREYLATGKPVVSVSTPEIDQFGAVVRIASGKEDFLRLLGMALEGETQEIRDQRIKSVAKMSWDARVDEVMDVIGRRLHAGIAN